MQTSLLIVSVIAVVALILAAIALHKVSKVVDKKENFVTDDDISKCLVGCSFDDPIRGQQLDTDCMGQCLKN